MIRGLENVSDISQLTRLHYRRAEGGCNPAPVRSGAESVSR